MIPRRAFAELVSGQSSRGDHLTDRRGADRQRVGCLVEGRFTALGAFALAVECDAVVMATGGLVQWGLCVSHVVITVWWTGAETDPKWRRRDFSAVHGLGQAKSSGTRLPNTQQYRIDRTSPCSGISNHHSYKQTVKSACLRWRNVPVTVVSTCRKHRVLKLDVSIKASRNYECANAAAVR